MTCALLISTYNWPIALTCCLRSIKMQSELPEEIIVCDDGSGPETRNVIEEFKKEFDIPLIHVWQEDNGFQLAKIRNKGFAASRSDYLIQIDGDLILHPHFISDHKNFAKQNYFTTGSRVLLSETTTGNLLNETNGKANIDSFNDKNLFNGLRIPFLQDFLSERYKTKGKHKYYVKGCNMAFWKSDIEKVNGYNESFKGWGKEDSEIAIRLINAGIKKRFLKFGGICYHLYHKEASREMEWENVMLMNKSIEEKLVASPNGLDQYLPPGLKS